MIVTLKDYFEIMEEKRKLIEYLKAQLMEKPILFIGYSLSDPDVLYFHIGTAFSLKPYNHKSYIVEYDVNEFDKKWLDSINVEVIDLKYWSGENISQKLQKFLTDLNNKVIEHRPKSPTIMHDTSFAEKYVPDDTKSSLQEKGYDLFACIEREASPGINSDYVQPSEIQADFGIIRGFTDPNITTEDYERPTEYGFYEGIAIGRKIIKDDN